MERSDDGLIAKMFLQQMNIVPFFQCAMCNKILLLPNVQECQPFATPPFPENVMPSLTAVKIPTTCSQSVESMFSLRHTTVAPSWTLFADCGGH